MSETAHEHLKDAGVNSELPSGAHRDAKLERDTADAGSDSESAAAPPSTSDDKLALTKRQSTDLLEPDKKALSKADESGAEDDAEERPLSDRGWHLGKNEIGNPLVEPLDNECVRVWVESAELRRLLWMLQRRFAKQIVCSRR